MRTAPVRVVPLQRMVIQAPLTSTSSSALFPATANQSAGGDDAIAPVSTLFDHAAADLLDRAAAETELQERRVPLFSKALYEYGDLRKVAEQMLSKGAEPIPRLDVLHSAHHVEAEASNALADVPPLLITRIDDKERVVRVFQVDPAVLADIQNLEVKEWNKINSNWNKKRKRAERGGRQLPVPSAARPDETAEQYASRLYRESMPESSTARGDPLESET